jgi:hypothetical protein
MKITPIGLAAIRNTAKKTNQKAILKQVARNLLRELLKESHQPVKKRTTHSTKRIRQTTSCEALASRKRRCNLVVKTRKKGFHL